MAIIISNTGFSVSKATLTGYINKCTFTDVNRGRKNGCMLLKPLMKS